MSLAVYGITVPSVNYSYSISEEFPDVNRRYKVESAITERYYSDHQPINAIFSNGGVSEDYNECILNSDQQELFDLKSFALEWKLRIQKSYGSKLDAGSNITLFDEPGRRILSKYSLFLNGTPCESNAYFGLYNTIKSDLEMSNNDLKTIGINMKYKEISTKIYDTYTPDTPAYFQSHPSDETEIQTECKNVLHMRIPLGKDMSSAEIF